MRAFAAARLDFFVACLGIACTPAGTAPAPAGVDVIALEPVAVAEPVCGGIDLVAAGPWRTDHPLFAPLRAGWAPRAESGRLVAVREAVAPVSMPGHVFLQLQLAGAPRDVVSCWLSTAPTETPDHRECAMTWRMVEQTPVESRPRTALAWAQLIGIEDGASAVFVTPEELARCNDALPAIHGWVPGLRGNPEAPALTFVERIDAPRSTIWLRAELRSNAVVDRSEIATVVHEGARAPEVAPDWDGVWPLAQDEIAAILQLREPRIHPLWRTPVTTPCPSLAFSQLTPDFADGDTISRVRGRLALIGDRRFGIRPSEVFLLHDHLDLPGVRLVAAVNTDTACMMGWSHTQCLMDDDAVWCPDGTAAGLQAIVDRFALVPGSLSDAQWFELVTMMTGASQLVIEPALLSECRLVPEARAVPPRVVRRWGEVTIEFTAIDDGDGHDYSVTIADGRVHMTVRDAWAAPSPDDDPLAGL